MKKMKKLKKIILVGMTVFSLNCQTLEKAKLSDYLNWYKINSKNVPEYVDTSFKINYYVKDDKNIKYIRDINHQGCADYWQLPQETLDEMLGDCEDKALTALALYYERVGKKGKLAWGKLGKVSHVEAVYDEGVFQDDFVIENYIEWDDIPEWFIKKRLISK